MDSKAQYSQRLKQREAELARLNLRHARIGSIRLLLAAAFLGTIWLCAGRVALPAGWLLLPVAAFIAVVFYHQGLQSRRARAQRAVFFYRAGLERMHDRWAGTGKQGTRFAIPHHIYADDVDLFGRGSLYELMCAARTQMGEAMLAQWLLAPARLDIIRERHGAVADLKTRLDLREQVSTYTDADIALHPETLIAWAQAPNTLDSTWLTWVAGTLVGLAIAAAGAWAIWGIYYPLLAILMIELAVTYATRTAVAAAVHAVEDAYEDLKHLAALLARLEAEPFVAAPLRALVQRLSSYSEAASTTLAKLATIVNLVESRRNPLLAPLLLVLLYPLQTALAAERWRARHGSAVAAWLSAAGEFEALLSLAQYGFEHPDDPLPEFIDGAASFDATGLGHPLIPSATRVCNDVALSSATRLLLVSGSNMSGKSTLLRTVGINTVLAMAGAPVRATRLRMTALQLGASIRVNDSLHEGSSRFYAEITRLRQLFEPLPLPLLFLLDELLQGTNSADRRVGAHGVIRALLNRGAVGLISTHDLTLTDIPGLAAGTVENVHFQDELIDGKLYFDFHLHDGIVTKSNGVELMRSIGLEV